MKNTIKTFIDSLTDEAIIKLHSSLDVSELQTYNFRKVAFLQSDFEDVHISQLTTARLEALSLIVQSLTPSKEAFIFPPEQLVEFLTHDDEELAAALKLNILYSVFIFTSQIDALVQATASDLTGIIEDGRFSYSPFIWLYYLHIARLEGTNRHVKPSELRRHIVQHFNVESDNPSMETGHGFEIAQTLACVRITHANLTQQLAGITDTGFSELFYTMAKRLHSLNPSHSLFEDAMGKENGYRQFLSRASKNLNQPSFA